MHCLTRSFQWTQKHVSKALKYILARRVGASFKSCLFKNADMHLHEDENNKLFMICADWGLLEWWRLSRTTSQGSVVRIGLA